MEKQLGKEYQKGSQRRNFLKDNCDKIMEKSYMKAYDSATLQSLKEELVDVSVRIDDIEEKRKRPSKDSMTN